MPQHPHSSREPQLETKRRKIRWDPRLHPRDRLGRFVETGGLARLWGSRGLFRVSRAFGDYVDLTDERTGRTRRVHRSRLQMVERPGGGRPTRDQEKVLEQDERHASAGEDQRSRRPPAGVRRLAQGAPPKTTEADRKPRRFARPNSVFDHWRRGGDANQESTKRLADEVTSASLSEDGGFVIGKHNGQWKVFHAGSGATIGGTFRTKREAVVAANAIEKVRTRDGERFDWSAPDAHERARNTPGLVEDVIEARDKALADLEREKQAKRREAAARRRARGDAERTPGDRSGEEREAPQPAQEREEPQPSATARTRQRDTSEPAPDGDRRQASSPARQRRGEPDPRDEFSPLERAQIRNAVDDYAGQYYGGPMGFGRDDAARYTSEGHLPDLVERHGLSKVWEAVRAEIDERPDVLDRSEDERRRLRNERRDRANRLVDEEALAAFKAGDYDRAEQLIDEAERLDPDARDEDDSDRRVKPSYDKIRAAIRKHRDQGAVTRRENEQQAEPDRQGEARAELRRPRGEVLEDVPAEQVREAERPQDVLPEPEHAGARPDRGGDGQRGPGGRPAGEPDVPADQGGVRGSEEGGGGGRAEGAGVPAAGAGNGAPSDGGSRAARVGGRGRATARARRGRAADQQSVAAGQEPRFRPESQADLAPRGERAKLDANLAALRLLRKLQAEDRPATPEEQRVLARWSGWGALPDVFDESKSKYAAERAELKQLLSRDEYEDARRTTLNAHYTDAAIVKEIWDGLRELGFKGGDVLEPGSGSGNFIGFAPEGVHMTGVELDPITSAISRYLYPDATIYNESFGSSPFREGVFDAVVGNVPFGNYSVADRKYNPDLKLPIHDHFILKALATTKPGGIAMLVTSSFTLDKMNPEARRKIAEYGDLLGAVRLPGKAHQAAAGTDVVTDVLVFRRRKPTDAPADMTWLHSSPAVHPDGTPVLGVREGDGQRRQLNINDYFRDNPDKVLGTIEDGGYNGIAVRANGDLQTQLRAALADIAAKANAADRGWNVDRDPEGLVVAKRSLGAGRDGRLTYLGEVPAGSGKKGSQHRFELVQDGVTREIQVPATQQEELRDLLEIRDAAEELIEAETQFDDSNPQVEQARKRLNRLYDTYVAKYGPITRFTEVHGTNKNGEPQVTRRKPPVMRFLKGDEGAASLFGLEHGYDPGTNKAKKADLFYRRQVDRDRKIPDRAETPEDALALAAERGERADAATIGRLLGIPPEQVEPLLVGQGIAFLDPDGDGTFVPADHYLSGNIREKLASARAAAEKDPKWQANVEALERVMPPDATLDDIPKQLGAPWIGVDVVKAFADSLMKTDVPITYSKETGWQVYTPKRGRVQALENEWGTKDRSFYQLLDAILKQRHKIITVTKKNADGSTYVDVEASRAAVAAAENIEAAWHDFLYSNSKIGDLVTARYNQKFRSIVPRVANTRPRAYPGMAAGKQLRPHQNAGVNRIVSDEAVLLEHVVGAGKTYTLAAGAMELRRLGLANKIAINVPNPLMAQWVSEFRELYPNARILAVDSDTLSGGPEARRRFAAMVRNNDWDAVIFTGEAFEAIPVSEQAYRDYLYREVELLQRRALKAREEGKHTTVKTLQKQIEQLKSRIESDIKARYDEGGITFEELGIDYVMVDEAHRFKNLPFATTIQGVQSPSGANRARDMHMKLELLRRRAEERGGPKRVVTFATGTPISNSLAEMYTMERMLRPDLLEEAGVEDFDSWAATFARMEKKIESDNASGGYVERVRFRGFTDAIGDGLRIWRSFSDTVTGRQLQEAGIIKVPKLAGGARKVHVVERTEAQDRAKLSFIERIEAIQRSGKPKKGDDTHVAVIRDGRAMAIDPRLMSKRGLEAAGIDPNDPTLDSPKLDAAAREIAAIWRRERDRRFKVNADDPDDAPLAERPGALQMVFIDSSAPKKGQFNAYDALKERLVAQGMDPSRIRYVQEAAGDPEAKARMMEEARQGGIDVLIGSTEALGTGTNVQNRLVAMHHIEASWKPSDIEQREGRGLRQGNQYDEVESHVYITKGTHDEKTWDMIAYKQAGLEALQNGSYDQKAIDFADDVDPLKEYDVLAGAAAEEPLAVDMRELEVRLRQLQAAQRLHERQQARAQSIIDNGKRDEQRYAAAVERLDRAIGERKDTSGDKFEMSVRSDPYTRSGTTVDTREAAAELLKSRLERILGASYMPAGTYPQGVVGEIGGFYVHASTVNVQGKKPEIELGLSLASDGEYGRPLPLETVKVTADDVAKNMRGVITRLENRIKGLEARRDYFKQRRAAVLQEIGAAEAQRGRPFRQAEELDNAQRRMRLLSTLLNAEATDDQGQPLSPEARDQLRQEYERLKADSERFGTVGGRRRPSFGEVVESAPPASASQPTREPELPPAPRTRADVERDLARIDPDAPAQADSEQAATEPVPELTPEQVQPELGGISLPPEPGEEIGARLEEGRRELREVAGDAELTPGARGAVAAAVEELNVGRARVADGDEAAGEDAIDNAVETLRAGAREALDEADRWRDDAREARAAGNEAEAEQFEERAETARQSSERLDDAADALEEASAVGDTPVVDESEVADLVEESAVAPAEPSGGAVRGEFTDAPVHPIDYRRMLRLSDEEREQVREAARAKWDAGAPLAAAWREALDEHEGRAAEPEVPDVTLDDGTGAEESDPLRDTPVGDLTDAQLPEALAQATADGDEERYDEIAAELQRRAEAAAQPDTAEREEAAPARAEQEQEAPTPAASGEPAEQPQPTQRQETEAPTEAPAEPPEVREERIKAAEHEKPPASAPDTGDTADTPQEIEELANEAAGTTPIQQLPGEKFPPSPQQQAIFDAVLSGRGTTKIEAKAGAGKTTTLEMLARRIAQQDPDERIAYIAFNKSVQVEAEGRMPDNTEPRTGHSIAFAWASKEIQDRTRATNPLRRPDEIAAHLGITEGLPSGDGPDLDPTEQAMAAIRTVDTWANSAEDTIGREHLPERIRSMPEATQDAIVALANRAWEDLKAPDGRLRLTLDHVRKMWALSRPDFTRPGSGLRRPATTLFLDEAQDTPPVLAKVIQDQNMRKVIVGDADQAIYGFTGAVDYLSSVDADADRDLNVSYRFGPQVADIANRFLQLHGSRGRVVGAGEDSIVTEPNTMEGADAILVRSNGGAISQIVREQAAGRTVGVPKGTKQELQSLVDTARYLQGRGPAPYKMHEDLAPFRTWHEVEVEAQKGDDPKLVMLERIVRENGLDRLDEIVQQVVELGDDGLAGVTFRDMPHGLVAEGKTYGAREILKQAGFQFLEVPGGGVYKTGRNRGKPVKAWTATGTPAEREAKLARARELAAGPQPDVVVSTAHKAKGLEWDRVRIGDDFRGPKEDPQTGELLMPAPEELRLAYVAVTRARKELDPGSLAYVYDYTDPNGEPRRDVEEPGAEVDRPQLDREQVQRDLAELEGATGTAPASEAPEATPEATPDVTPEPAEPDTAPEAPEPDTPEVPAEPAAAPEPPAQVTRVEPTELRVGDLIEGRRPDGSVGPLTVESVAVQGNHYLVTGRDENGNRNWVRIPRSGAAAATLATRLADAPEGAESAWGRDVTPEDPGDRPGPMLPEHLRVGDRFEASLTIAGRRVRQPVRLVEPIRRRNALFHEAVVEDDHGERHRINLNSRRPVNVLERAPEPDRDEERDRDEARGREDERQPGAPLDREREEEERRRADTTDRDLELERELEREREQEGDRDRARDRERERDRDRDGGRGERDGELGEPDDRDRDDETEDEERRRRRRDRRRRRRRRDRDRDLGPDLDRPSPDLPDLDLPDAGLPDDEQRGADTSTGRDDRPDLDLDQPRVDAPSVDTSPGGGPSASPVDELRDRFRAGLPENPELSDSHREFLQQLADNPTLSLSPGGGLAYWSNDGGQTYQFAPANSGVSIGPPSRTASTRGGAEGAAALAALYEQEIRDAEGRPFPWTQPLTFAEMRAWRSDRGENLLGAMERVRRQHEERPRGAYTKLPDDVWPVPETRREAGSVAYADGTPVVVETDRGEERGVAQGLRDVDGWPHQIVQWPDGSFDEVRLSDVRAAEGTPNLTRPMRPAAGLPDVSRERAASFDAAEDAGDRWATLPAEHIRPYDSIHAGARQRGQDVPSAVTQVTPGESDGQPGVWVRLYDPDGFRRVFYPNGTPVRVGVFTGRRVDDEAAGYMSPDLPRFIRPTRDGFTPEQIAGIADHDAMVAVKTGDNWYLGTFRRPDPGDDTYTLDTPQGERQIPAADIDEINLVAGQADVPGWPRRADTLPEGVRVRGVDTGRTPRVGRLVAPDTIRDDQGRDHKLPDGAEVQPIYRYRMGHPSEPPTTRPSGEWTQQGDGSIAASGSGWEATIRPVDPDDGGEPAADGGGPYEWRVVGRGEGAEGRSASGRAPTLEFAKDQVEAAVAGIAPWGRFSRPRDPEPSPHLPADEQPAEAPEPINGRQAEWTRVADLQPGDVARVSGIDSRGRPSTRAGYVLSWPTQVTVSRGRRGTRQMYSVAIGSDPNGRDGDRGQVYMPIDAVAARAARPEVAKDPASGGTPSYSQVEVVAGYLPDRVPVDSSGRGVFPGSLVSREGEQGIVTEVSRTLATVNWGDDRVTEERPGTLTVVEMAQNRPDGWTIGGERIRPGQYVQSSSGAIRGIVEDVDGDVVTIGTPQGTRRMSAQGLTVIGEVRPDAPETAPAPPAGVSEKEAGELKPGDVVLLDGLAPTVVASAPQRDGDRVRFEVRDLATGEVQEYESDRGALVQLATGETEGPVEVGAGDVPDRADPPSVTVDSPTPIEEVSGPTATPAMHPAWRDAVLDLGLDLDVTSPPDVAQAAARLRARLPVSGRQADALADVLDRFAEDEENANRALLRRASRALRRAAAEARGEPFEEPTPTEQAARVSASELAEGDVVAVPRPDGSVAVGPVLRIDQAMRGRVWRLRIGGEDRDEVRTVDSESPVWKLDDLPAVQEPADPELPQIDPDEVARNNWRETVRPVVRDRIAETVDAVMADAGDEGEPAGVAMSGQSPEQVAANVDRQLENTAERFYDRLTAAGVAGEEREAVLEAARNAAHDVAEEVRANAAATVDDVEPIPGETEQETIERARRSAAKVAEVADVEGWAEVAVDRAESLLDGDAPRLDPEQRERAIRQIVDAADEDLDRAVDDLFTIAHREELAGMLDEEDEDAAGEVSADTPVPSTVPAPRPPVGRARDRRPERRRPTAPRGRRGRRRPPSLLELFVEYSLREGTRPSRRAVRRAARAAAGGVDPSPGLVRRVWRWLAERRRALIARIAAALRAGYRGLRRLLRRIAEGMKRAWRDAAGFFDGADPAHRRRGKDTSPAPEAAEPRDFAGRVEFWRSRLPEPGRFGKVRTTRPRYSARLADLISRGRVNVDTSERWELDRAVDGGPGEVANGHLAALRGLGGAVDDEVTARVRAAAPELGDDPHATVASARKAADDAEADWRRLEAEGSPDADAAQEAAWAARAAADRLGRIYADAVAEASRQVLAQVRSMGPDGAARLDIRGKADDAPEVRALRWAEQYMPTDWLRAVAQQPIHVTAADRGSYEQDTGHMAVADLGPEQVTGAGRYGASALHELAHHLEHHLPDLRAAQWAYHWARTSTGLVGSRVREGRNARVSIADLFPGRGHDPSEVTREDWWLNAYIGREYDDLDAWEIFAMGVEALFGGADWLDDDMRKFLLGMLASLQAQGRV